MEFGGGEGEEGMEERSMKIEMYKCDFCGALSETEHPYSLKLYYGNKKPMHEPSVSTSYRSYGDYIGVCSKKCAHKELAMWFDAKVEGEANPITVSASSDEDEL